MIEMSDSVMESIDKIKSNLVETFDDIPYYETARAKQFDNLLTRIERLIEDENDINRVRRGQADIYRGEHMYYAIKEGTNIRHETCDCPIIYTDVEMVYNISGHAYVPIKVSDYNEMFGRFME